MAVLVSYHEHTKHLTLFHQIFMITKSEIVTQVVCFEVVLKFFGSELHKGMWRIEKWIRECFRHRDAFERAFERMKKWVRHMRR